MWVIYRLNTEITFYKDIFHQLSTTVQFVATPEGIMWIKIAGYNEWKW